MYNDENLHAVTLLTAHKVIGGPGAFCLSVLDLRLFLDATSSILYFLPPLHPPW